jgi:hypothetical protein
VLGDLAEQAHRHARQVVDEHVAQFRRARGGEVVELGDGDRGCLAADQ